MGTTLPAQAPAPYNDRHIWLIVFGVAEVLVGCFFVKVGMMFVSMSLEGTRHPLSALRPALMLLYNLAHFGGLAAVFFIIGIGSILCRNWARVASLVISGLWLCAGVSGSLNYFFVLSPGLSAEEEVDIFVGLFTIILPAVFLFFYSRKSVRETCFARGKRQPAQMTPSPVSVLSRDVPTGVLFLASYQLFSLYALVISTAILNVAIFFGTILHGLAALLLTVLISAVYSYDAWAVYRRKLVGWWLAVFLAVFSLANIVATYHGHTFSQVWLSGPGGDVGALLPGVEAVTLASTALWTAAMLAFLLYVKKYFVRTSSASEYKPQFG